MKVLLSAFACDPSKGSEPGNGWHWAVGLANKGYKIHCLTREEGKKSIELHNKHDNLCFHYIVLPLGLEKLYYSSTAGMYLYYLLWQFVSYRKSKKLHRHMQFAVVHHVTWGSLQMGSFLYKLGIPFIFGPAGGGQKAPASFKKYFLTYWAAEEKREKISNFLVNHSPACRKMLRKASAVLVSNTDTLNMAKNNGAARVDLILDAALPSSFFPENRVVKSPVKNNLKLLWVGRFMPRKGILLLLDVMKELKEYPGITLTVVGDGEMKDAFLSKLKEYELEATVHWKGKVPYEQVREYYASHDVFFYTSLRDSCPAQLIEAMAFGLPVVTLNLHGQAQLIDDERGVRCACDTPEMAIKELVKALLYLYNSGEVVSKMSCAAFTFAAKQTWTAKIDHIVNQYYPV